MNRFMIEHHLRYNIYPPVTAEMVPYCIDAIDKVSCGLSHWEIEFPNGDSIPAGQIVEDLHLEDFVEENSLQFHMED